MVSNILYFHPYLGKIPILTNIFQLGWNHQPDLFFLKTNISPEKWWLEDDPVLLKWRRSFIFGAVILRISKKFGGLVKYILVKLTYKVGPKNSYK